MIVKGNSRGNARLLSHYLVTQQDNEAIRILDVDGQLNPNAGDLHRALFLMGVSAELSKSRKGLYHAQINPAIGEDVLMEDKDWLKASDILGRQLGLLNQRRIIVLHTKKGRIHAHVVWERYDHDKGRMVSDSFSRLAQDRARKEMEAVFNHAPTPHRNTRRPELKASLSALWKQTRTGKDFIHAARQHGYIIAEGAGRSPYIVVDDTRRSYDLTRQLQGVRLKEVRQRLRGEPLQGNTSTSKYEAATPSANAIFADNKNDMVSSNTRQKPVLHLMERFKDNKPGITEQIPKPFRPSDTVSYFRRPGIGYRLCLY
jgi:hypothetical protein